MQHGGDGQPDCRAVRDANAPEQIERELLPDEVGDDFIIGVPQDDGTVSPRDPRTDVPLAGPGCERAFEIERAVGSGGRVEVSYVDRRQRIGVREGGDKRQGEGRATREPATKGAHDREG